MLELNKIYNEDCLEGMKRIPDKRVDMIICDLPYGTTTCKWDSIISLDKLWEQYMRIIKDNSAIVLTSVEPFTSTLINSNKDLFRYKWIWKKTKPIGFPNCNQRPLKTFEEICVFSKNPYVFRKNKPLGKYNPQGLIQSNKKIKRTKVDYVMSSGGDMAKEYVQKYTNYPLDIIEFPNTSNKNIHPTQKPVELFEYLIKTYSHEGDLVLDNCMGSGTTAIAAINTNRNYIGFELEKEYYNIAQERIKNHNTNRLEV